MSELLSYLLKRFVQKNKFIQEQSKAYKTDLLIPSLNQFIKKNIISGTYLCNSINMVSSLTKVCS